MAGRGHVDINERRLRPIYDCLDNGNNKKAIQEADKVLKKQKDFFCAKALKAVALNRVGKQNEAFPLLKEVHDACPTDEATLQAMSISYKEMQRLDLITELYERAHKSRPDNEDILSTLFMWYVRLGEYKKQQQTAMVLHRLRPNKNPYYFWAVMSIVMQARTSDPKLAKTMLLPLAERMSKKYIDEGKIDAEAEVQLYLLILELMEKYEEALEVVQGETKGKLSQDVVYREEKTAELLRLLKRWPQANAAYRRLLERDPDRWDHYFHYFESVFALVDVGWASETDLVKQSDFSIDNTVELAAKFVETQISNVEGKGVFRGPYLARLELYRRLRKRGDVQEIAKLGSAVDLLRAYFAKFGDKPSCFSDIHTFFDLLSTAEQQQLTRDLLDETGLGSFSAQHINFPPDEKSMHRHICMTVLSRHSGAHHALTVAERLSLIGELDDRYWDGLRFGVDLLPTDFQPCDAYLQLSVYILFDLYQSTGDTSYLGRSICTLERGLHKSPSNYQFKLLLVRLYTILGVFGPCNQLHELINIKHIQIDTLGYFFANHALRLGNFADALAIYDGTLRFFNSNHKDTTEFLISAYRYGSFLKVEEFVNFRERLQNSWQYVSVAMEKMLLCLVYNTKSHDQTEEVLSGMSVDPTEDATKWEDLRDNRDLEVIISWDPPGERTNEELRRLSFEEEKLWLRLRTMHLRALVAMLKMSGTGTVVDKSSPSSSFLSSSPEIQQSPQQNGTSNEGVRAQSAAMADMLQKLVVEFEALLEDGQKMEFLKNCPLNGPAPTRLCTYNNLQLGPIFVHLLRMALYLYQRSSQSSEASIDQKMEEQMKTELPEKISNLAKPAGSNLTNGDKRATLADEMERIVLLTEGLGEFTVIAGAAHRMLKRLKAAFVKKMKKKKPGDGSVNMPDIFSNFNALVESLAELRKTLLAQIQEVNTTVVVEALSALKLQPVVDGEANEDVNDERSMLKSEVAEAVSKKVDSGLQQAIQEITQLIESKTEYIEALKL